MKLYLIPLAVLFVITTTCTAWSAPLTTYIAEFSVSGADKPAETKSTIQTLLLSRLAGDKITTVTKPDGAALQVSGSYLQSGAMFSLDAAVTNSSGAVVTRAFSQGKSVDDLIPAITALAKSLTDGIEKGAAVAAPVPAAVVPVPVAAAVPVPVAAPDIIKSTQPAPAAVSGPTFFKLDGAAGSMALGRTLPSGERELFVTGSYTLRYYRLGTELKLLAEIPYKVYEKLLSVDTADLDGDGTPEIYVTMMANDLLKSQVWTVDGTTLKKIAGPLPYLFRTVTTGSGVPKLYAQMMSGSNKFSGAVAELVKSGNDYILKDDVKLPHEGYLYNFMVLKGSKGEKNPVIIDRSGYLRVFTPGLDELWKSSEEFGGSEMFFWGAERDPASDDAKRKVFLEPRMVITAAGDLLVPKNTESWFMRNKHYYSGSSLYSFSWNGSVLHEKWHTKPTDYYMADFAYDNTSHELFMLEVVAKEEGIFDKGVSRLVIKKIE